MSLRWLVINRFNLIGLCFIGLTAGALVHGDYLAALAIWVMGSLLDYIIVKHVAQEMRKHLKQQQGKGE